ncbi:MAG: MmgE/PrpD family protein [Haloarculaceae archaeon]
MSITDQYASYCAALAFEDLPDEVVERTKHLLLDTVGVSVGSIRADSSDAFLDGTRTRNQDGDGATVLATGERMSPEYATLVNGALAHSLDYDDTHRGASLHPGAPVIPAALAAGEEVDASGEELLTAVVAGYELTCRLGMAVNPASHYDRGFHMTATCGLFGATAAAGVVYGFDEDEFASAFGINGSQAAGSLQFLENGGWNKRAHPGFAGHNALLATAYAQEDFRAAAEPIEGVRGFLQAYSDDPDPEKATAGLGTDYELLNVGVKPYPCCRYMHAPLDALFELIDEADIAHEDVEGVTVNIASAGIDLIGDPTNRYPQSFVDCQFSMPFGAALALVYRDDGVETFFDAIEGGVNDDVKRIIDLTTVSEADWIEEVYPDRWPAKVTVETADGTYARQVDYARGEPENALSWEELVEKYDELTVPILGGEAAAETRAVVESLESRSVAELASAFADASRQPTAADD